MRAAVAVAPRAPLLHAVELNSAHGANAYAHASAQLWGRLRTVEALAGDHALVAMASDELNRGAAYGYARDLERVAKLLGEAIRILGDKGGSHGNT